MLLEALIALLIFSMGILAIVGLQTASVKIAGDAKYRTEASLLANQLIGQMWVSNRTAATLRTNFSSTPQGAAYVAWAGSMPSPADGTVMATLPGVSAYPPTVTVQLVVGPTTTTSLVTITIFWKAPSDPAAAPPHQYMTVAQII
jgi:type IV pilus assembly protein PilV